MADLGYLDESEQTESWKLANYFFPSKFGGRPSWLALEGIPGPIKCKYCTRPLKFLLQIYSPGDSKSAFHRVVYVFVCESPLCYRIGKSPIAVFSSQLPKANPFYPPELPSPEASLELNFDQLPLDSRKVNLCWVCGANSGNNKCGRCKTAFYCSAEHQKWHWTKGGHKEGCSKEGTRGEGDAAAALCLYNEKFCFREREILMNSSIDDGSSGDGGSSDESDEDHEEEEEENEVVAGAGRGGSYDRCFDRFMHKTATFRKQLLRHDIGRPLLVTDYRKAEILNFQPGVCNFCKEARQFEFQILPQMLYYLPEPGKNADMDIDWACIYIFTCRNCCDSESESDRSGICYLEETGIVQYFQTKM